MKFLQRFFAAVAACAALAGCGGGGSGGASFPAFFPSASGVDAAQGAQGAGGEAGAATVPDPEPASSVLPAPGALVASSGATWIKLNWTAPVLSDGDKIDGYRLAYRLAGDADWTERDVDGGDTSAYFVGLAPDSSYAVRIAAVGQAGQGAAAQQDSVATGSLIAFAVPQAPFEYAFEDASLANTGSLGAAMNGTAAGPGVGFETDAARGKVLRLSQDANAKGWVTVPRAVNGTAYTKSVWVKFTSYSGNQNLISSDNGEFAGKNTAFFSDLTLILKGQPAHFVEDNKAKARPGQHVFSMQADQAISTGGHGGKADSVVDATGVPALGTWYNFVVTYDAVVSGGVLRLYRNGVKVAQKTGVPGLGNQTSDFTIGAFAGADALNGGFLDNVRVYDGALDDGAISDIYAKEVVR
jgi:hypothetical protein